MYINIYRILKRFIKINAVYTEKPEAHLSTSSGVFSPRVGVGISCSPEMFGVFWAVKCLLLKRRERATSQKNEKER